MEMAKVVTDEDAIKGMTAITDKINDLYDKLKQQKAAADAHERDLQKQVDESRDALVSLNLFLFSYWLSGFLLI